MSWSALLRRLLFLVILVIFGFAGFVAACTPARHLLDTADPTPSGPAPEPELFSGLGSGPDERLAAWEALRPALQDALDMFCAYVKIVLRACESPLRTMARNAGESEDIIIEKVREEQGDKGYDFLNRCMVSTYERGIIDPKKVTRCALENAASAAGTLLTTSHAIVKV